MDTVGQSGGLWLDMEPSLEEVKQAIDGVDLKHYTEIVFCGFGEPTERLDTLLQTAAYIKQVCPDKKIRHQYQRFGRFVQRRADCTEDARAH